MPFRAAKAVALRVPFLFTVVWPDPAQTGAGPRGRVMKSVSTIKKAAWSTLATFGLLTGSAFAGGVNVGVGVGIQIGDAPPPPPAVVVIERPVVVDTYVVGYRTNLYDADMRLRLAQADQYHASESLEGARRHEGEVAVALEEEEHVAADLHRQVGDADLSLEAAHAACATPPKTQPIFAPG